MQHSRPRIYISGPISKGDKFDNLNQAADAHKWLVDNGFAPLNPILTMLIPWAPDVQHSVWMECDLPWVEQADAVFRLQGESEGADMEVRHARENDIPVFTNLEDVKEHFYE